MDMKDIMIRITGTQAGEEGEVEKSDFISEGKLGKDGDFFCAEFEEGLMTGEEPYKTTIRYSKDFLRLNRQGAGGKHVSSMEFEAGGNFSSLYSTPYGNMDMSIHTNKYKSNFDENGLGSVFVDYKVILSGLAELHNKINLQFGETMQDLKQIDLEKDREFEEEV